ncbi:hypothetical protein R6Q59_017806 [Mikania micrantha]
MPLYELTDSWLYQAKKDREFLELASSFQSTSGKSVTKYLSIARRVRSSLRTAERPSFVSAFCQSNCGDVSPNVLGAFCTDTGLPCDFNHSTCGGKNELCYGRGPGYPDEFESTRIIGERQFKKASDLFTRASEKLNGKIDFRHTYLDFSKIEVTLPKQGGGSESVKTCPAAMGFAFAAGTTDGPGAFDFKQGDNTGNPFWKLVRNVLRTQNSQPWLEGVYVMRELRLCMVRILSVLTSKNSQSLQQPLSLGEPLKRGHNTRSTKEADKLATRCCGGLHPLGVKFGDVSTDIPKNSTFKKGDMVTIVFGQRVLEMIL